MSFIGSLFPRSILMFIFITINKEKSQTIEKETGYVKYTFSLFK